MCTLVYSILEERTMSTNLKEIISSKLVNATDRISEDYNSLAKFEKELKTPNLTTMQLNSIGESLSNIESRLRNFSYKGISKTNKELFLNDLKDIFYTYINQRNILQTKLLSLQNRVDTRILIHKKREADKNKILSEQLSEIQTKLKSILKDIHYFDVDLPLSQLLEHYKLINRNLNKILNDLGQDSFNLFKEGEEYKQTLSALMLVKDEFSKLKKSLASIPIPISDMTRLLESLRLTYGDKIPVYEIYESFNPVTKEEVQKSIIEAIKDPTYFPNFSMSLDTKNELESFIIFKSKELQEITQSETKIDSERRYEIFKRVLKKFETIKISQLASLLGMNNETEVLEYILEIPDEFGFKIQNDMLIIEQHEVLEHIDMLVSMFETDSAYGKESKI